MKILIFIFSSLALFSCSSKTTVATNSSELRLPASPTIFDTKIIPSCEDYPKMKMKLRTQDPIPSNLIKRDTELLVMCPEYSSSTYLCRENNVANARYEVGKPYIARAGCFRVKDNELLGAFEGTQFFDSGD